MYLEDGKCAQCGKIIAESTKFAPHNVEYLRIVTEATKRQLEYAPKHKYTVYEDKILPIPYQPYFCSPSCIEAAAKHYLNQKFEQEYQNDLAAFKRDADAKTKLLERERKQQLAIDKENYDTSGISSEFVIASWRERYQRDVVKTNHKYDRKLSDLQETLQQELNKLEQSRLDSLNTFMNFAKENFCYHYYHAVAAHQAANQPPPPPTITDPNRFEHTHILGPSGSGKSTIIQQIVLDDLAKPNPPAMIIIDPKGLMVERLAKLLCFHPTKGKLRDRLIFIKADDDPAPALNLFRRTGDRAMVNQAISTFDYIFAQAGNPLTPKMRPVFKFCAALMFSIPDADIFLLMDFLESAPNDPRFEPYIANLTDLGAKRFFSKDFYSSNYRETREQVKGRFNDILSMPELLNIFCSKAPSIDFGKCLNERKIILVDTGMTKATPGVSELLGRYIITLTLNAVFARTQIPRNEWTPAFLFIDEFQDFVDEDATPRHFRLAREYNLGLLCAHQNMYCAELNDSIRTAISTNTTIKYCAKPEAMDKSYMARDCRCFLFVPRKRLQHAHLFLRPRTAPRYLLRHLCSPCTIAATESATIIIQKRLRSVPPISPRLPTRNGKHKI